MIFKSDVKELATAIVIPDHKEVPQLYRASLEFAKEQGGERFRKLMDQFAELFKDDGYKYTSIDTRTHMLMTGMYPCIPGWHCDDFYRPGGGQPDLVNVEKEASQVHYLICIGDCSLTEFAVEDLELPSPHELPTEKPMYFYYDKALEEKPFFSMNVKENTIYSFGPLAFHRGQAATKNGWRTFIRVTRSNHRDNKNEIRYQSNVYIRGDISW